MTHDDQLDIRELKPGVYRLEFPFNAEFIEWLKRRVPFLDRSYDEATHFWEIRGEKYLNPIIGVGAQKFTYAIYIFRRGNTEVWKNLRTGQELVQENLF